MNPAQSWLEQGNALFHQQQWQQAAAAYLEAVRADPANADAWHLLGSAQQNANQLTAAQDSFERCLTLTPGRPDATIRYAFLLNLMGQPQKAINRLHQALAQAPQLSIGWLVLGHAYHLLGDVDTAIEATRRAVTTGPEQPQAPYQLADMLLTTWQLDECEAVLSKLLSSHPDFADAWALLGLCLRSESRHAESLDALRRSLSLQMNPLHHSKYLAGLQYVQEATPEQLWQAHLEWHQLHGVQSADVRWAGRPLPAKLRLGFISADFARHPIGFLALGALQSLDKQRVEVVCYSDRALEDEFTAQFRASADQWRTVKGQTDDQVAEQIRADGIHILFDLVGHFGERMGLFPKKPAPVQISWLGYVGTTGLSAIDYVLADRFHVAAGEEQYYSERVLRMPHGYACYLPPAAAPDVGPLPAHSSARLTFGCFNNPAKYSPQLLDAWRRILQALPSSQLLLKFGGLDQAGVRSRLYGEFHQRGIDLSRVLLEPMSPHFEALNAYNRVDLALDTQPYSGGLTTCEALWMGVPVVTFPGLTFAGRHSTSHLYNAGYPQFVASNWSGYVELAVRWGSDWQALATVRGTMRKQVQRSALCDREQFAREFVELLAQCWTAPV